MTSYDQLTFEVRDAVAFITLNRPDALNAIDVGLVAELADAALRCDCDRNVRAVLLRGAGRVFCAGGDLTSFVEQGNDLDRYIKETTTHLHSAISRFARMDAPVIGAVHGAAAGAGMSLACACDIVVAAESTRFTLAYTRVGLTPDGSASYFLPWIVGQKRALDLALTNRTLTAQEAQEWGLVARVVADDALLEEAETLARQLAAGPTGTFGATKRLLQLSRSESLETQMAHETETIATIAKTADAREGMTAFLQKREPVFKPRS